MPRRARLAIAGIPWHIIQRGNNRSACFYSDDDYLYYLHHLEGQSARHGCVIHAYVLMTSHVHLLLTPETEKSASMMMKHLGQRYVQYINRTYRRSGTLWEGRFKSCLVQEDDYVLACYRYIELNPVRAAMVRHPGDYPWSSYRANAQGMERALITPHQNYLNLHVDPWQRVQAYQSLVDQQCSVETLDRIRAATNGNIALGGRQFESEIAEMLQRRATRGRPGRPRKGKD